MLFTSGLCGSPALDLSSSDIPLGRPPGLRDVTQVCCDPSCFIFSVVLGSSDKGDVHLVTLLNVCPLLTRNSSPQAETFPRVVPQCPGCLGLEPQSTITEHLSSVGPMLHCLCPHSREEQKAETRGQKPPPLHIPTPPELVPTQTDPITVKRIKFIIRQHGS